MPLAIYIHWPFCQSKCPYCDFNSHVAASIDHAVWRDAYVREIGYYADLLPGREITSIFFGGGTPSLMEPATVELILQTIARHWRVAPTVEITLEANPGSVEAQKFVDFSKAGVNRLSLGVQSLRDEDLKFLGRKHDVAQAKRAIETARNHFPRFSFDLIYARHGQNEKMWEAELREALDLSNGHLSLYQLTIEPNTQFYTLANRGEKLTAPDHDAANMFELTQQIMQDAGMPAYEISNHARIGDESRHNLTYWRYNDYIGIGPGAHGRYGEKIPLPSREGLGERAIRNPKSENNGTPPLLASPSRGEEPLSIIATEDHKAPEVWLKHVAEKNQGLRVCDAIDADTAQREALMMNLRLTAGIDAKAWQQKFGSSLFDFLNPNKIQHLIGEGYIVQSDQTLKATASGLQRLNAVLGYLLG